MMKKAKLDQVTIEKKAEVHQIEYLEQLRKRHEMGRRTKIRATGPRKKETVETHEGPAVALVIKGNKISRLYPMMTLCYLRELILLFFSNMHEM